MSAKRAGKTITTVTTGSSSKKKRASYGNDRCADSKRAFLTAHLWGASISDAARLIGVPKGTLYSWRNQDPEFALAWREAHDKLVEDLEMAAFKRAIDGNDRLIIFLLKSYKPDTYSEKKETKPSKPIGMNVAELAEKVRQWL